MRAADSSKHPGQLRALFARIHRGLYQVHLLRAFYTKDDPRLRRFDIGSYTYGIPTVQFANSGATLTIGRYCSIASDVTILLGGNHRADWITTYPFSAIFQEHRGFAGHPSTKGDVIIGNDVWVGRGALILSGVRIGNGAVIGAQSVVSKDVPPYAIAAGNPARVVRARMAEEWIQRIQHTEWWKCEPRELETVMPYLLSDDLVSFVTEYERSVARSARVSAQTASAGPLGR